MTDVLKAEVSEMNSDDVLAHFGVAGMKWGRRRGKKTTGVSRASGALIDRNDRTKKVLMDAKSGAKHRRSVAVGKKIIGEAQWEKNFKKSMSDINAQNSRLRKGKATIGDKIDMAVNVSAFDLVVSRRPKD